MAHADLAEAMVRAVSRIAGIHDALTPLSNESRRPEEMQRVLEVACGRGPAVVFTDLASGSCALAGRLVAARAGHTRVVTGCNLPMLLDFVFHRDMELEPLVARLVRKGRDALGAPAPVAPLARGPAEDVDRTVSDR